MSKWMETSLRELLLSTFAGEWGENPYPYNAKVIRATDITDDMKVNLEGGAPRLILETKLEEKKLVDGDIILEGSGGSIEKPVGRVAYFDVTKATNETFLVSNFFRTLRPNKDVVEPKFLYWLLNWFYKQPALRAMQQQTTGIINLKLQQYLDTLHHLPECKTEQSTIARILDSLDSQILETEAIIAKLQQVKHGLLHDLLSRGINERGEVRPSYKDAPEMYKASGLGWIPKEWNEVSLADISIIKSGSTPSRTKAEIYFCSEGGFPWVKTMDLNEDVIVHTDEQITQKALDKTSCMLYPQESVLVAMYGGWEQIGRVAMLADEAATNQAISALIFNKDDIVPEFVLRSLQFHRPGWKKVAASTRKDPNITKSDVEKFKIAVPENTDEQKHIVEVYREMINETNAEKLNLDKLISKKAGLMDDLLTGKIRVSELLKRK